MTPARNNGSLGGTPLQQLPTPGSVKMLTSDDDDDDEFDPRTATTASTCPEGGNDDLADDMLSQNRLVIVTDSYLVRSIRVLYRYTDLHNTDVTSLMARLRYKVSLIARDM